MSGRINNATRGLIFWCTLGELVLPVAAQVDQQKSRNYFDEARVICERDGGRLWGVSLCGPMVFADARTQTFATNQPPPAADRPRALGFANAPIEWGGQTWAAYIWDFITVDDPQHRGVLMLHELFHRIQPQLGLRAPNGHNDHLDTVEGRYWLQLEWRALARALRLSGYRRTEAIRDALAFRLNRHGVFPGAAENERRDEIREGLAQYTGTVAAARSAADAVGSSIAQLADAERQATFVGTFAYTSGAAYGILLDALLPNWRRQVQATSDLAQLLKAAAGIQPTQKLSDASSNYGGAELRATEGKREEQQRARVADLRRQFVEGPVLLLPRAGGATLDTRGATPIPGSGIVYVSYRVNGEWGSLQATNGVLVSADGKTLAVPAPTRVDGTPLAGDGWTVTLASGWVVRPGPRSPIIRCFEKVVE